MRLHFFLRGKKSEFPEMVSQVPGRHKIIKQCIACVFGLGTGDISQISRGRQQQDKKASVGAIREVWGKLSTGRTLEAKKFLVGKGI